MNLQYIDHYKNHLDKNKNYDSSVGRNLFLKPYLFGFLASIILFGLYITILTLTESLQSAYSQYLAYWPWFIILVIGFGIQVGQFFYMKGYELVTQTIHIGKKTVVATAGISGGTMLACCLHYVAEVLPFLGISALATFIGEFQTSFLEIGIASNAIGISFIMKTIQKHGMVMGDGIMSKMLLLKWKYIFYLSIAILIVVLIKFIIIYK